MYSKIFSQMYDKFLSTFCKLLFPKYQFSQFLHVRHFIATFKRIPIQTCVKIHFLWGFIFVVFHVAINYSKITSITISKSIHVHFIINHRHNFIDVKLMSSVNYTSITFSSIIDPKFFFLLLLLVLKLKTFHTKSK